MTGCHIFLGIMKNFSDVIDLWPSITELATDIGEKPNLVSQWRKRKSIPSERWLALIAAAERRGYPVDAMVLANLSSRRQEESAA